MAEQAMIDQCIKDRLCECGGELEVVEYPIFRCRLCQVNANINFFPTREEYANFIASELSDMVEQSSKPDIVKLCKKCDFVSMEEFVVCPKCDEKLEEMPVTEYLAKMSSGDGKLPETIEEKVAFFLNLIELKKDMLVKLAYCDFDYQDFYYDRGLEIDLLNKIREDFISIFNVGFLETEKGKKVVIDERVRNTN